MSSNQTPENKPRPQLYPDSNHRFFVYDPEDGGLAFYATREERDAALKPAISAYCDDGWSEEVTNVCAGEVTHVTVQTNVRQRPAPCQIHPDHDDEVCDACEEWTAWPDHSFDEVCSYEARELHPLAAPPATTPPTPQVAQALDRVGEFAKVWRWQRERQQIATIQDGRDSCCALSVEDIEALLSCVGGVPAQ